MSLTFIKNLVSTIVPKYLPIIFSPLNSSAMKNTGYVFIMMFFFIISSHGQTQYTSVPRTGEGRVDRSGNTIFWPNPIFFKPSVFFSSSEANIRADRKWWREAEGLLPKPNVAHGYLPEGINLESCLDFAFTGVSTPYCNVEGENNPATEVINMQSMTQYLTEALGDSKYQSLRISFSRIQNFTNQQYPQQFQIVLGY